MQQLFLFSGDAFLADQKLPDEIVNLYRRMSESFPRLRLEDFDELVVFIQRDAFGVRERPDLAELARRIVADAHRRAELQHRLFIALACVCVCGELRIAERVHHAVIAHAVAGAEVLVRGIIEHAPAETARMLPRRYRRIERSCMAQGMRLPLAPRIEGLGRKHVPRMLGNQERLFGIGRDLILPADRIVERERLEIVVGVDVLQKIAFHEIPYAGGRARRIEKVRKRVGLFIERVVVAALVDADAPQHDRRMVAVLQHHFAHVVDRLLLPCFVADVLPAGDLREHQKPELVAGVDEVLTLRIVRRAHRVAAKLLLQDPRVLALKPLRRGIAHVRIRLMAIESAQKRAFAVQIEAVLPELRGAEAEARQNDVLFLHVGIVQGRFKGVEIRRITGPRLRVRHMHGRRPHKKPLRRGDHRVGIRIGVLRDAHPRAVQHALTDHGRFARNSALHFCGMQVRRCNKHVCKAGIVSHVEPDVAVQTAVGQVVDDIAERRNIGVLRGIQPHGEKVRSVKPHVIRDLDAKRRVAGAVRDKLFSVHIDRRDMRRAVELQKEPLFAHRFVERERSAVAVHALVILRSRIVLRDRTRIVRQTDRFALAFAEPESVRPYRCEFPSV